MSITVGNKLKLTFYEENTSKSKISISSLKLAKIGMSKTLLVTSYYYI